MSILTRARFLSAFAVFAILQIPFHASAHCDTLDGPVVQDARMALQKKDPAPVLKWVKPADEKNIREAFQKTLIVREKGPEARDLADTFFFETLVRVHRAGEGAPFTGLKPAGTELEPGIAEADKALETGSADALTKQAAILVNEGIQKRFQDALTKKKHADESVAAGREYVEAYVQYVHYVERIFKDAGSSKAAHDHETESTQSEDAHQEEKSASETEHSHHE